MVPSGSLTGFAVHGQLHQIPLLEAAILELQAMYEELAQRAQGRARPARSARQDVWNTKDYEGDALIL